MTLRDGDFLQERDRKGFYEGPSEKEHNEGPSISRGWLIWTTVTCRNMQEIIIAKTCDLSREGMHWGRYSIRDVRGCVLQSKRVSLSGDGTIYLLFYLSAYSFGASRVECSPALCMCGSYLKTDVARHSLADASDVTGL